MGSRRSKTVRTTLQDDNLGAFYFPVTISYIAPQHGTLVQAPQHWPAAGVYYQPNAGFVGIDSFQIVAHFGDIVAPPFTVYVGVGDGRLIWDILNEDPYFGVAETGTTTFTNDETGFVRPGKSATPGHLPSHGDLALGSNGGFSYTPRPDPVTGEVYVGWDSFSFLVNNADGTTQEQWVQLDVGYPVGTSYTPPPQIVTKAESDWVPSPFNGTLDALETEYNRVKGLATTVLSGWNALGSKVQEIYNARNDTDDVVLGKVDGAIAQLDTLERDYRTYLDGFNDLNSHAGSYQSTWAAYWDNLTHGTRYYNVLMGIQALPRDIGGLKPNKDYAQKLTQALADFGKGAGVAVDNAGIVVTVAETTHDVLEKILWAGGVATMAVSAAEILVEQGLATCARQVVTNLVVAQVANYAAQQAMGLAQALGVPGDYVRIGADALQVVMLWRAAKAQRQGCFVAGTQVLTGRASDGAPITRNIEDLRAGDLVLSRNENDANDDLDLRQVVSVSTRTVFRLAHVDLRDAAGHIEQLRPTAEHPFWVLGAGWTPASELKPTDTLVTDDGSHVLVTGMSIVDHPEGVTVYNLTVDTDHTYYVEDGLGIAAPVWVHNPKCGIEPTNPYRKAGLPTRNGNYRYVPPKSASGPIRGPQGGYMDKFGNEWVKGPPHHFLGDPFEWDVQLEDGSGHLNVSMDGVVAN